jgi:hypothetical protein
MKNKYPANVFRKAVWLLALGCFITIMVWYLSGLVSSGKSIDDVSVPVLSQAESNHLKKYNNPYHVKVGQTKGLQEPLYSKDDYILPNGKYKPIKGLTLLTDNKYYELPKLTNSLPYLQPDAKRFFDELGHRFTKRLDSMGIRPYRFTISSVLRTMDDQKKLRKNNVNATQNTSSHYYARTVDIAQTRFFERGNPEPVYSYRLRNVLLRELIEMQNEGKCYVILESATKCIHITVR